MQVIINIWEVDIMNQLSIKNQERVLKVLIRLCSESPTHWICKPVNFTDNFKFITVESLIVILQILSDKMLITVQYADYPDNFNIHTLHVTPKGYDYHPQKSLRTKEKWLERLYGFIFGTLLGAMLTYFMPIIIAHIGGTT